MGFNSGFKGLSVEDYRTEVSDEGQITWHTFVYTLINYLCFMNVGEFYEYLKKFYLLQKGQIRSSSEINYKKLAGSVLFSVHISAHFRLE